MQNYTILAASYKTKLTFVPYDPLITLPDTYSKDVKTCPHKSLHVDAQYPWTDNCQNLEATKLSFSRWLDKLQFIQTMEYYLVLNKKWAIKPWKDME